MARKGKEIIWFAVGAFALIGVLFGDDDEELVVSSSIQPDINQNIAKPISNKNLTTEPNTTKITNRSSKPMIIPLNSIPRDVPIKSVKNKTSQQSKLVIKTEKVAARKVSLGLRYIVKPVVNVRAKPTIKSSKVGKLKLNTKLEYFEIRNNWYLVQFSKNRSFGWVRGDMMSKIKPKRKIKPKLTTPIALKQSKRTGAIRSPFRGKCDCPYDLTRKGKRCGKRSAYSRPGGASPRCYY